MRRAILTLTLLAAALWSAPSLAQSRKQLGPLCTTDTTPADQMIDACNKIIALKVFSGEKLAGIYFWRAVGWNKKGDYNQVIADASEALRLKPDIAIYNLRGSAYYDKGEYDIAISDFNDALRLGPPSGILFHNRGNAWRGKGEYAKAIADYDASINAGRKSPFSYQNRGISKQALGDLDGAMADINEAIRLDAALPQPLIHRAVLWRAKGDFERAIADGTEAIRLAKAKAPVNIMTPPGSVLISAYSQRGLAYEAKGDFTSAKQDYAATLEGKASDAGSKSNQATAKVRLSLLSDATAPAPRDATSNTTCNTTPAPAGAASPAPPPAPVQGTHAARRARDRQRRLYARHAAAQPGQRRPLDRQEPARHRLRGERRHRSRSRGDAIDDPRIPARCGTGAGRGGLLRRSRRAGRGPQLSGADRRGAAGRRPHDGCDGGNGYDHGRPRRSGAHQHPDHGCLPQQSHDSPWRRRKWLPRAPIAASRPDRASPHRPALAPARRWARER